MTNDQLTRAERIRLEALSQAVNATTITVSRPTLEVVLQNAERIEAWLKMARDDG